MAMLGESIDPRLMRLDPQVFKSIESAGAAYGDMYANVGSNLGKTITSMMQKREQRRIDKILNEALIPQEGELSLGAKKQVVTSPDGLYDKGSFYHPDTRGPGYQPVIPVLDSKGNPTTFFKLDQKVFRARVADKGIPEKQIAAFLKNENAAINSNNTTQMALAALENQRETNRTTIQLAEEKETTRQTEIKAGILREEGYQEERMGVITQTRDTQKKLLDQQILETEAAVAELAAGTAERTATAEGRKAEKEMFDEFKIQLERGRAVINNPESTQDDYAKIQTDLGSLLNTYGLATSQETLAMGQLEGLGELMMDEKLDLDDQINAAANALYADTTQVELFNQKRAGDPQALLTKMLTLLEDPNIKTEKLETLYTLLNQDERNKAAARGTLGLNGSNPPPAAATQTSATQTSASGNRIYEKPWVWEPLRKEGVPYLGAPTIGETQIGQNLHRFLTPDQDK